MRPIKILGYIYEIKNQLAPEDGGAHEAGRLFSSKQVITIDPSACQQAQESTMLHEILEALNYHLELDMDNRVISSLESGLYAVLKDNGVDISGLLKEG